MKEGTYINGHNESRANIGREVPLPSTVQVLGNGLASVPFLALADNQVP